MAIVYPAFHKSAANGHLDVVKYCLEMDTEINRECAEALNTAASNGWLEGVKFMVQHVKDINPECAVDLGASAADGHFEIVKCLVEKGLGMRKEWEITHYKTSCPSRCTFTR